METITAQKSTSNEVLFSILFCGQFPYAGKHAVGHKEHGRNDNGQKAKPSPYAGRDLYQDIHHGSAAIRGAASQVQIIGAVNIEIADQREHNENCHKGRCQPDPLHLRTESVNKGHIEHRQNGQNVLQPILIIAIVCRAGGGNHGRGEKRENAHGQADVEANLVHPLALLHDHEDGRDAGPLTHLKRKLIQQILLRGIAAAYVQKTPEVGHLCQKHYECENESEVFLVLPFPQGVTVSVEQEDTCRQEDQRDKMLDGVILEISLFSVAEEAFFEKLNPYFHV